MFLFDALVCCGAFTEVYIGKFRKNGQQILWQRDIFYLIHLLLELGLVRLEKIQFGRLKFTFLVDHVHMQYPLLTHFY